MEHCDDEEGDVRTCGICLEPMNEAASLAQLMCGHEFHTACIIPWIQQCKTTCPMCRQDGTSRETGSTSESAYSRNMRNYRKRSNRLCKRDPHVQVARANMREAEALVRKSEQAQHQLHLEMMRDERAVAARHDIRRARRHLMAAQVVYDRLIESHIGPAPQRYAELLQATNDLSMA